MEFVPLAMVPVVVPLSVPVPVLTLKLKAVGCVTLLGFPPASWDCTTTAKGTPVTGPLTPSTDVMASFAGGPAVTVIEGLVLDVFVLSVPILPVALPGEAVSPGTRSCSFVDAPAVTVIAELVFAVSAPSVAVIVRLPAVLSVTVKSLVPATSGAAAGRTAFASLEVRVVETVELTRFQFASTAFTVTVNGLPAV